jgi:hypothetical protein
LAVLKFAQLGAELGELVLMKRDGAAVVSVDMKPDFDLADFLPKRSDLSVAGGEYGHSSASLLMVARRRRTSGLPPGLRAAAAKENCRG